ncbi:MAG: insulinase family protein, partial [Bifidobacteriaceae bacterium]|jgi:predicted Zn-dependent peptidase|nr:insulinase family protein [Bifidobacteriaceae bacterium]
VAKPFSQTQVMVGCSGLTATDPRRYAMMVFSSILGGGMSSRLFQTIREQRGLAYSTYCFSHPHSDVGSFGVYAACAPTASAEVTGLMEAEWELLAANGPTDDEMARVKGQIRGSALLANEEAFAHMNRLGRGEILMGELPSIHEVLGRVDAVTAADVRELGADLAARARSRVVVGPA